MKIRRAEERGHGDHGWLDTWHTFSFGDYSDRRFTGHRSLRVLNDDRVAAGAGFPEHSHQDMEIITLVLEGALAHADSMGNGSTMRPGEIQKMSAGTGVTHSERNASSDEPVHFLQIWIEPDQYGIEPMYEQRRTRLSERPNEIQVLGGPPGSDALVTIYQDIRMLGVTLVDGSVRWGLSADRHGWLHVAKGSIVVGKESLNAGDGAALDPGRVLDLRSDGEDATVLIFDLA